MTVRVTIEIIPGGIESHPRRKVIGVVNITNTGGGAELSDYAFKMDKSLFNKPKETWRAGKIAGFPRLKLGPYDLVYRCLRAAVGKRNP